MTDYRYNNVTVSDLGVLGARLVRLLGIIPVGISDSGNTTVITYNPDLTAAQKTALDSFMAGSNIDQIPASTNTTFTFDAIDNIKTLLASLDCDIYPTPGGGCTIIFTRPLTNTEKNNLKNTVAGLLKQIIA